MINFESAASIIGPAGGGAVGGFSRSVGGTQTYSSTASTTSASYEASEEGGSGRSEGSTIVTAIAIDGTTISSNASVSDSSSQTAKDTETFVANSDLTAISTGTFGSGFTSTYVATTSVETYVTNLSNHYSVEESGSGATNYLAKTSSGVGQTTVSYESGSTAEGVNANTGKGTGEVIGTETNTSSSTSTQTTYSGTSSTSFAVSLTQTVSQRSTGGSATGSQTYYSAGTTSGSVEAYPLAISTYTLESTIATTTATGSSTVNTTATTSASSWLLDYSSAATTSIFQSVADTNPTLTSTILTNETGSFTRTSSIGAARMDSTWWPKYGVTSQSDTGLWVWKNRGGVVSGTSTAAFTDCFSSTAGETLLIPGYQQTRSGATPYQVVSISGQTTVVAGSDATYAVLKESTNGFAPSASDDPLTATAQENFSGVGDVGGSAVTWTFVNSTGGTSTGTSTQWTHAGYGSGYSTSATNAAPQWTQTSSVRSDNGIFSSRQKTVQRAYSVTATSESTINKLRWHSDTVLISSFSRVGSGEAARNHLLGMKTTTSLRAETYTDTAPVEFPLVTSVSNYALSFYGDDWAAMLAASDDVAGNTVSTAESAAMTFVRNEVVVPSVHWQSVGAHVARHMAWPNGYAGFGGTYDPAALSPHLSTSSGKISGDEFGTPSLRLRGDSMSEFADKKRLAWSGVTYFPMVSGDNPIQAWSSGTYEMFGWTNTFIGEAPGLASARWLTTSSASTSAAQVAATWTSTYSTVTGTPATTVTQTSSRFATYAFGLATPLSGDWFASQSLATVTGAGPAQSVGGFGLGHNALPGKSYTVSFGVGRVQWREYSAGDSTGGSLNLSSNTIGSLSITVPHDRAIAFTAEPLVVACWASAGNPVIPIQKFYPIP